MLHNINKYVPISITIFTTNITHTCDSCTVIKYIVNIDYKNVSVIKFRIPIGIVIR